MTGYSNVQYQFIFEKQKKKPCLRGVLRYQLCYMKRPLVAGLMSLEISAENQNQFLNLMKICYFAFSTHKLLGIH